MGADVAASPHCPFAVDTKPGRRGRPLRAVSKPDRKPKLPCPGFRSPASRRSVRPVSPPAPRPGPGALAVRRWRIGRPCGRPIPSFAWPATEAAACAIHGNPWGRSLAGPPGITSACASDPPDFTWACARDPSGFTWACARDQPDLTLACASDRPLPHLGLHPGSAIRSPQARKPGPARPTRSRSQGSTGGGGFASRPPGSSWAEAPGLPFWIPPPEGFEDPGRSTKLATLASAQGQARSFRTAAASSAAPPSLPSGPRSRRTDSTGFPLRPWLERLRPFPVGPFRPHPIDLTEMRFAQTQSRSNGLWITRKTGIRFAGRGFGGPRAAAPESARGPACGRDEPCLKGRIFHRLSKGSAGAWTIVSTR